MPTTKRRIAQRDAAEGKRFKGGEAPESTNDLHPHFALHKMLPPKCGPAERAALFDHFRAWSTLTWRDIRADKKRGFGLEKLPIGRFRADVRSAVTPDADHLMVGRFSKIGRFVGYPISEVFYVVALDEDHTSYT